MSECADGDGLFGPYSQQEAQDVHDRLETLSGYDDGLHVHIVDPTRATLDVDAFYREQMNERDPHVDDTLYKLRHFLKNPFLEEGDYRSFPIGSDVAPEVHEVKIVMPSTMTFCIVDMKHDRRDGTEDE